MFANFKFNSDINKAYDELILYTKSLISVEGDKNANQANIISMLNYFLKEINWVGFYFFDKKTDNLVLSHFNGLPACTRIKLEKGVCATSFINKETIIVSDVNEFEGHIACDSNSQSEIVIPLIINNEIIGVLDIDSPIKNRFNDEDKFGLEKFVKEVILGQLYV